MNRPCRNCDAYVLWGVFCVDCVRAMAIGAMGTIGTVAAGWLLLWLRG